MKPLPSINGEDDDVVMGEEESSPAESENEKPVSEFTKLLCSQLFPKSEFILQHRPEVNVDLQYRADQVRLGPHRLAFLVLVQTLC